MPSNSSSFFSSARRPFRISRQLVTAQGFTNDIDPRVAAQLDTLATLLDKRVFALAKDDQGNDDKQYLRDSVADEQAGDANVGDGAEARAAARQPLLSLSAVKLTLTPQHVPKLQDGRGWKEGSLADMLNKAGALQRAATLAERIDTDPVLSKMKYALLSDLDDELLGMKLEVRAVLQRAPLLNYLVVLAARSLNITDSDPLRQFMFNNPHGLQKILQVAGIGAARALIFDEQLKVQSANDDAGAFVKRLLAKPVPLSALAFEPAVRDVVRAFMFDRDEEKLIRLAKLPQLTADQQARLIRAIQRSPIRIDEDNAAQLLPPMLIDILGNGAGDASAGGGDSTPLDDDFEVQFIDDTTADGSAQISRSAVLCAAQLYHSMVLGDELDAFGAAHYLIFQRPHIHGGMRISDPQLRDDLQLYALDNEFSDLRRRAGRDARPLTCTRPAERQMFHRQVFDEGHAQVPDDLPLNPEFRQLWKVLMLESARYLERAQASLHPESFVSPQNVMQAVEDLQYNLSNYCTGMATVISPRIDAELNFVMERVLKHPDVIRHVVPEGGTWKQVVDRLNTERRQRPGKASTLYNKAALGKGILEAIADYTPANFELDDVFSDFISKVDAFITTQSILLRPRLDALDDARETDDARYAPALPAPDSGYPTGGAPMADKVPAATADEWDF